MTFTFWMLIHAIAGGSPNPNSVHLTIWIVSLTSQNPTPLSRFPCCLFHINRHFVNRRGTSSSLKFLHVVLGTRILSANKMPIYPKIHLSNFLTICIGPERWRGPQASYCKDGKGRKVFPRFEFPKIWKRQIFKPDKWQNLRRKKCKLCHNAKILYFLTFSMYIWKVNRYML